MNDFDEECRGATGAVYAGDQSIIEMLPCYLSIQDASFTILRTNQSFRTDFGEGIGKKCYEVYKKSKRRCPGCPLWETFHDKKVHMSQETVQLADGRMVQTIVYSAPILDASGRVAAAMELSTDISKVKARQEELMILGQSMAVLSHDIKNVLQNLQGSTYVVDEAIKDGDPELAKRGWAVVRRNIYQMTFLVQNILYFSKKRKPLVEAIDLETALMDAIGFFYDKAQAIDCRIRAQVNPDLPAVYLDTGGFRRMLMNLVSNGLEACSRDKSKPSHSISVKADFYDREHFMIQVEDDGIGMDQDTREKIFSRFFSTKGVDGTGLGLMVVHEIVEEHEGRIEVLSEPGKGSTFKVILRLGPPDALPANSPSRS